MEEAITDMVSETGMYSATLRLDCSLNCFSWDQHSERLVGVYSHDLEYNRREPTFGFD